MAKVPRSTHTLVDAPNGGVRKRRRSSGSVYRPASYDPVFDKDGNRVLDENGKPKTKKRLARNYWIKWTDEYGKQRREVLLLPTGGKVYSKRAAEDIKNDIIDRRDRFVVGLCDSEVDSAFMYTGELIEGTVADLRRRGATDKHAGQTERFAKRVFEAGGIEFLAAFTTLNVTAALAALDDGKRGPRTLNSYREAAYAVGAWAEKMGFISSNPVAKIDKLNVAVDVRKVRRALTMDELYRLLEASGPRRNFWTVAAWTGLRMSELGGLCWRNLVGLDSDRPAYRLAAKQQKSRRPSGDIALHDDIAALLLDMKPANAKLDDPVFAAVPKVDTFHKDCERAGIPRYADDGTSVDRHCLRVTFKTMLAVAGVDGTARDKLTRHAPQGMDRSYIDLKLIDVWGAINLLPPITQDAKQAKTGTGF